MKAKITVRARIYAFQHRTSGRIRKARHTSRRDALRYLTEVLEPFWTARQVRLIWVDREERVYGGASGAPEKFRPGWDPSFRGDDKKCGDGQGGTAGKRGKIEAARNAESEAVDLAAETGWVAAAQ